MGRIGKSWLMFCALALVVGCSSSDDSQPPTTSGSGGAAGAGGAAGNAGSAMDGSSRADAPSDTSSEATDAALDVGSLPDATHDTGDEMTPDGGDDASVPLAPPMLSATGFFTRFAADGGFVYGAGVRPYQPRFALWSDGADKRRWVYLPSFSKIDNTDQDHWSFPVGTKFWKEFSVNGNKIETRLIQRFGPGPDDYLYATYQWKPVDAGGLPDDAVLVPGSSHVLNANGTDHDVPFEEHCHRCHDPSKEHVLGFSAFQLTPASPAPPPGSVTIKTLSDEGLLLSPSPNGFQVPGSSPTIQNALAYMHANCGNCHNDTPGVAIPAPKLNLRLLVGQLTAEQTGAYTTALNVLVTKPDHSATPLDYRIFGGDPAKSALSWRMELRGMTNDIPAQDQMPPLATEHPDTMNLATVNAWIRSLPPPADK